MNLSILLVLIGGLALTAASVALLRRPIIIIAITLISVLLFDHFPIGAPSAFIRPELYDNFNKTLNIGGLFINPVEILLMLLSAGWLTQAVSGRLPGRPLLAVSILGITWAIAVAFAAWWGLANGGNGKIGLWILRPVIYFLGFGFLTYQVVRTPRQVAWLFGCIFAAIVIKSCVTILLWWHYHADDLECYVSHEDTSFCLYILWVMIAAFFLRPELSHRWRMTALLIPIIILAVIFNDRRINFLTLVLGTGLILAAVPKDSLIRRGMWMGGAAIGIVIYVLLSIVGPENSITRPVKGIMSGLQSEVANKNTDTSSQYRKFERYDLNSTIRAYPTLGAGLGVKYLQPIKLPKLSFEYSVYIAHNQIVMTHALMGPCAYFILLFFYMVLFAQLLNFYRCLRNPWHQCLALAAAASVANWLIIGYYDMQLFFFRNSIIVGIFVALPACLMRWQQETDAQNNTSAALITKPLGTASC